MLTQWRVLDFTQFSGRLRYRLSQLTVVSEDGTETVVPLADVAVVLLGSHCLFSAGVLQGLTSADCAVIVCDWRGVPSCYTAPWADHSRVATRQIAQAALSVPRKKNAWGRIVKAKVTGQANTLRSLGFQSKAIADKAPQVRSGDPTNVEGSAASLYWRLLFGSNFQRRQDSSDHINSALNYAYTVLRGHTMRAVVGAGLCPTLGVFHCGRANCFALADDLIEPFRPAVDFFIAQRFREDPKITLDDPLFKQYLVTACAEVFSSEGKSIPGALQDFATHYGAYVEGAVSTLSVPTWVGPVSSSDE